MKPYTYPVSYRLSDRAVALVDRLQCVLGLNKTGVVETAIRELALKHEVALRVEAVEVREKRR